MQYSQVNRSGNRGRQTEQYGRSNRPGMNDRKDTRRNEREVPSERWAYSQNGVRVLQITQDGKRVNVTLLRYTNSTASFTTNTVWKLPFNLKNMRTYLMHPFLTEIEKEALAERLGGLSTDQFKFEHLINFRLASICKAMPLSGGVENYTNQAPYDLYKVERLGLESKNLFVEEVLAKNAIPLKFIK